MERTLRHDFAIKLNYNLNRLSTSIEEYNKLSGNLATGMIKLEAAKKNKSDTPEMHQFVSAAEAKSLEKLEDAAKAAEEVQLILCPNVCNPVKIVKPKQKAK